MLKTDHILQISWVPTLWMPTRFPGAHPNMGMDTDPGQGIAHTRHILHSQLHTTHGNITCNNPHMFFAQNRSQTEA